MPFESFDSLSPFTSPNLTAIACCIRCHLPDAICSCGDATSRKSIGNGTFPCSTYARTILKNSTGIRICAQKLTYIPISGGLDDVFADLHAALQGSDAVLSSAAPDVMHAPIDREADSKTIQIPSDREHGCVAQLQPSTSTPFYEAKALTLM